MSRGFYNCTLTITFLYNWRYCNKTGTRTVSGPIKNKKNKNQKNKKHNYLRCCTIAPVHEDAGERRKDVPREGEEGGTTLIPVGGG
jgi:hypothetical protein